MHALKRFSTARAVFRNTAARQSAASLFVPAAFVRATVLSRAPSSSPTRAHSGSAPSSPTLLLRNVPAASTGLEVNAGVLSHLQLMARYHCWANARLLADHVSKLSDAEYFGAAGDSLFFRSVHGTLVHMIVADKLWLTRLTTGGQTGSEFLWADAATAQDTERFMPDRAQVTAALLQGSKDFEAFVASLTNASVVEMFSYRNTSGKELSAMRSLILTHVFNHSTHHRGQITVSLARLCAHLLAPSLALVLMLFPRVRVVLQAALRQLGHPSPALDLLYMLNPAA